MTAQLPRAALDARLRALPAPDNEEFQPTNFFRNLLDTHNVTLPAIEHEVLFADHQRLQERLSNALAAFHHHRASHGIEFAVQLAKRGPGHARPYLADLGRWIGELERMIEAERSAVERPTVLVSFMR